MNIPQVNAQATDRNREQTKRIMEILDDGTDPLFDYDLFQNSSCYNSASIINGSFALCQVVGMLRERNCFWVAHQQRTDILARKGIAAVGGKWVRDIVSTDERGRRCHDFEDLVCDFPHDLTAALDALIKVLEAKP